MIPLYNLNKSFDPPFWTKKKYLIPQFSGAPLPVKNDTSLSLKGNLKRYQKLSDTRKLNEWIKKEKSKEYTNILYILETGPVTLGNSRTLGQNSCPALRDLTS